jgi:hypothetical protein
MRFLQHVGHAKNRIHGSAYLVAHRGQKPLLALPQGAKGIITLEFGEIT